MVYSKLAQNTKYKLLNTGFTLIELILVVSIISIISVMYSSVGTGFLIRNSTQNTTNELISSLRIAQLNSIVAKRGMPWGVRVESEQIVLFVGDSYSERDPTFDEVFNVASSITISPQPVEVNFEELTGNSTPVDISITNNIGDSSTISVNEVGIVDVN